jgi:nucleoside-diphosphate-sugar epimerase
LANSRASAFSRRILTTTIRRALSSSATGTDGLNKDKSSNFRAPVLNQDMTIKDGIPTIIVAGAAGHMGKKIFNRLITTTAAEFLDVPLSGRPVDAAMDSSGAHPTRFKIVLMDQKPCPSDLNIDDVNGHEVEYVQCDFLKYDKSWATKFSKAYVAFLLATRVHFPSATSDEAHDSMLISSNLLEACIAGEVERVVLGSSTDVLRGKVQETIEKHDVKSMESVPYIDHAEEPTIPGKREICGSEVDSRLYAAAKVAAEAQAQAMIEAGNLKRVIILRLGACYPIENVAPNERAKVTLSNSHSQQKAEGADYMLDWFRQVTLSDDDLNNIIDCCISPSLDSAPEDKKVIFVNAVSESPGSKLRIEDNQLGYFPPSRAQAQHPPPPA